MRFKQYCIALTLITVTSVKTQCQELSIGDKGDIDLINEVKKMANLVRTTVGRIELSAGADSSWVAIARTQLQLGFMALDRAVAKQTSF